MTEKRTRYRRICMRVSEEEFNAFDAFTARAKISKDTYLRGLINGLMMKPAPSDEMVEIIRQLQRIGNNINQLAMIANKNGSSDVVLYKENYRQLLELIEMIMDLIQEPLVMKEPICP